MIRPGPKGYQATASEAGASLPSLLIGVAIAGVLAGIAGEQFTSTRDVFSQGVVQRRALTSLKETRNIIRQRIERRIRLGKVPGILVSETDRSTFFVRNRMAGANPSSSTISETQFQTVCDPKPVNSTLAALDLGTIPSDYCGGKSLGVPCPDGRLRIKVLEKSDYSGAVTGTSYLPKVPHAGSILREPLAAALCVINESMFLTTPGNFGIFPANGGVRIEVALSYLTPAGAVKWQREILDATVRDVYLSPVEFVRKN